MAFGGLRGTLTGFGTSIVTPETADGSVVVSVQDLIVVMVAEAAANTVTTVTDNFGQTYTAINAGTLSSVGLRGYYRYVTVAGTLTQISCVMTSSSNDHAISVAVYEGPFTSTPLDRAPTNTTDAATPYTCAATTVLSQANELIISGLGLIRCQTATATAPNILAINTLSAAANTNNAVSATIGQQLVAATTSVTPVFASSGTITGGVQIVATFRQGVVDTTRGTASSTSTSSGTGCYDISRVGTAAAVTTATTGSGYSDIARTGSASATATVTATGLATTGTSPLGLISFASVSTGDQNSRTTPPIDTTGANLIFAHVSHAVGVSVTISDNYSNTWALDLAQGNRSTSPDVVARIYRVASLTPNVGPGHTFTFNGVNSFSTIQFSAWRSGTPDSTPPGIAVGIGALPHGTSGLSVASGDLVFALAVSNSTLSTVSQGTILDKVDATLNYATGFAYFIQSGSSTINVSWSGGGDAVVTNYAFHGTWQATDTGIGTASAHSTANAVALADTGTGTASAHGTATGVSPSVGASLIAHAEGYGGPTGGVTNSVNTTGANLLVVHITGTTGAGGTPSFTDNKGNIWTLINMRGDNAGGGKDYAYYVNSQTPTVGTGHSVNYTSANTYSSAELLAFYIPGPWTFDEFQGSIVTTPSTGPSLTPEQTDELIISTVCGDGASSFTAVSDGLSIITSGAGVPAVNFVTGSAYKIQPSLTPVAATWTATGSSSVAIQIFAFKPHTYTPLINHVESYGPADYGSTASIDTTGANLLVLGVSGYQPGLIGTIFSDSKGNTWTQLGAGQGTGAGQDRLYYVNSQTPNVGTGHSVSTLITGAYVSLQFMAFKSNGSWSLDQLQQSNADLPNAGPTLTPSTANELVISTTTDTIGAGTLTGVSDGLVLVASQPLVSGNNFGTAWAYKVHPTTAPVQATWIGTPAGHNLGIHLVAFQGSWLSAAAGADTGVGTATATSTVNATSRYDVARQATSTATSTANATGRSDNPRQGIATATSTVNATSRIDVARTGSATANSTASAQSYSGSGLATTRYVDPDTFGTAVVGRGPVTLTSTRYIDPDTFGTTARIGLNLLTTRYVDPDSFGTTTRIGYRLLQARYVDPDTFGTTARISLRLTTSLYVDPDTFRTPVVTRGTRNLLAVNYINPDDFGTHVIQQQGGPKYLGHNLYIDPDTFRTPIIGRGPVGVSSTRYVDPDTFGTPAVIRGTRNLTTVRYADPDTFRTTVIVQGPGVQNLVPAKYANNNNFLAHQLHATYIAHHTRYVDADTYYQQILVSIYHLVSSRLVDADQFYQQRVTTQRQLLTVKYNNQSQFYSTEVILGKTVLVPLLVNHSTYGTPAITIRFAQHIDPTLYEDPDYFYTHIIRIPPTAGISAIPGRYIVTNNPLREIVTGVANHRVVQSNRGAKMERVIVSKMDSD